MKYSLPSKGEPPIWPDHLRRVLERAPELVDLVVSTDKQALGGFDGEARFKVGDDIYRLLIECKTSSQPRHVREAATQLRRYVSAAGEATQGIIVAPFLSPASRDVLRHEGFGWLDLAGNVRITLPRFYIEVSATNADPFSTKRPLRALFSPKSSRVIKALIYHPHAWKVKDLAAQAQLSMGQVSNVRQALVDREWAQVEPGEGLRLTRPEQVLDAWRDDGGEPPARSEHGYTIKHGPALEQALDAAFAEAQSTGAKMLLASHSVARRLAPYARVSGEFFYADSAGMKLLEKHLQFAPTNKGENVTIYPASSNDSVWFDQMPVDELTGTRPPKWGTGPIQTYLDLTAAGDRAQEAAKHWREKMLAPLLKQQD